jgi:protein transport protein HofB
MSEIMTQAPLYQTLMQEGLLAEDVFNKALFQSQQTGQSVLVYCLQLGLLDEAKIMPALQRIFDQAFFTIDQFDSSQVSLDQAGFELSKQQGYLVLSSSAGFCVLMLDPSDAKRIACVEAELGVNVKTKLVGFSDFQTMMSIVRLHLKDDNNENAVNDASDETAAYCETLIKTAVKNKASDIHLEHFVAGFRVRLRQDGVLREIDPPKNPGALIAKLKVKSQLDISITRLPQDGALVFHCLGEKIPVRISTCPCEQGEKVVLRFVGVHQAQSLKKLGFDQTQFNAVNDALSSTQGLILVTGPTGSGKTVTQYSLLNSLNHPSINICTVEDPVEHHFNGINQVSVQADIGRTFETVLRAFLRQDPDVLMIGEIRDAATADIAVKAAMTGHLVLATLHSGNTLQALTRLENLNVNEADMGSCVKLIIAQRLVRLLCHHCRCLTTPSKDECARFDLQADESVYVAQSCEYCYQGYSGRMAIFEVLSVTPETFNQTDALLHDATLLAEGKKAVLAGLTSLAELQRVVI